MGLKSPMPRLAAEGVTADRLVRHFLSAIYGSYEGTLKFRELVTSIRDQGLLHPIVLLDGKVLEGWHRLKACLEVGHEPQFIEFTGCDPVGYVIAANSTRRQLSQAQTGLIAARLHRDGDGGGERYTGDVVCKIFGIGETVLVEAGRVLRHGSEGLVKLVEAGAIPMKTAARAATSIPSKEQERLAALGASAVEDRVRQIRQQHQTASRQVTSRPPAPVTTTTTVPPALRPTNAPADVGPPPSSTPKRGCPQLTPKVEAGDTLEDVARQLQFLKGKIENLLDTPQGAKFRRYCESAGVKWFDRDIGFVGLAPVWRLAVAASEKDEHSRDQIRRLVSE